MTANDAFTTLATCSVAALGETVTYITQTGRQHSIKALISEQLDVFGNRTGEQGREIRVTRASAPKLTRGETIIASDGTAYRVEDITDNDGYVITVSAAHV